MARNSEKAVTALARWRALQLKDHGKVHNDRRPYLTAEENDVRRAEKWRNQVIREIAKKVAQIQNAGLGEFKLRDLNDEINKLLREKHAWEARIIELGGPNYMRIGPKLLDKEGKEVPGSNGYKYFGAAKDLPGVKELFDAEVVSGNKKTRAELMREIDAEYYGYLDDEDYLLVPQEEKCEKEARQKKIEEFQAEGHQQAMETNEEEEQAYSESDEENEGKPREKSVKKKIKKQNIEVPSLKEVEQAILEKKKRELLSKYVSEELIETENEAKRLTGQV